MAARSILPIAIGVLVGLAFGFFLRPLVVSPEAPIARPQAVASDQDSSKTPGGNRKDADASPRSMASSAASESRPVDKQSPESESSSKSSDANELSLRGLLGAALADLPKPAKIVGTGQITGFVGVAETSEPIAGVLVEARGFVDDEFAAPSTTARTTANPRSDPDVAELAAKAIETSVAAHRRYYYTHTGADGRYVLSDLPDAMYTIRAQGPGYEFSVYDPVSGKTAKSPSYQNRPGSDVEFRGTVSVEVLVDIVMPDGSRSKSMTLNYGPCPHEWESLSPDELAKHIKRFELQGTMSWRTNGELVRLSPGLNAIFAKPSNNNGLVYADPVLVRVGADPIDRVTIQLKSVVGISVEIVDESGDVGDRRRTLDVYCVPYGSAEPPTLRELRDSHRGDSEYRQRWQPGSGSSKVVFRHAVPGKYAVVVSEWDYLKGQAIVALDSDPVDVKVVLSPPPRHEYAVVWVKGPDGKLLTNGVAFSTRLSSGSRSSAAGGVYDLLKEGSYRCMHHTSISAESDEGEKWSMKIEHPMFGVKIIDYVKSEADEFTVQFDAPATISVTILGWDTHPLRSRLKIHAVEDPAGSSFLDSRHSRRGPLLNGTVQLGPIQPAEYSVLLYLENAGWTERELVEVKVNAVSGDNVVKIAIPDLHAVTFSVPMSGPGTVVKLSKVVTMKVADMVAYSFREVASDKTDSNRRLVIPNLPAGKYRVEVVSHGSSTYPAYLDIEVPQQSTVTLVPER